MHWRHLPPQTGLSRATASLDNARNAQKRSHALKSCKEAKESLERIKISNASPIDLERIIVKYREHGATLEWLDLKVEAQLSYSKADELRASANNIHPTSVQRHHSENAAQGTKAPSSAPSFAIPSGANPAAPSPAPSVNTPFATPPSSTSCRPGSNGVSLANIFTKDYLPPLPPYTLPRPDERLVNSRQLANCLGLLQASPLPDVPVNSSARTWTEITRKNPMEQERLQTMATDLIRAYFRDELKDAKAIAEVVCLAPVLEKEDYRTLLSHLVDGIEGSSLLHIQSLEGLAQLLQGTPSRYLHADDLVKILDLLNSRLQDTHRQSPQHISRLTLTIAQVLDAMVDCDVKDLDRINLHGPLLEYLEGLNSNKDPYMVFQAAYTYQALLSVPDNESSWQATLRRSGMVLKGVSGLVSAAKGLNVNEFIEGVDHIQGGLKGIGQVYGLAKDAYEGVSTLMESGETLLDALKKGLSFSQKRDWYPMLRGIDTLLQTGELTKFKALVFEAPCRRDPAFLWGVCQRLGDLASDPIWDVDARQGAIAFLGEIYWNDTEWGQEPQIKQYILDILSRLSSVPSVGVQADTLLKELAKDDDETKRTLYEGCVKKGPSAHPWKGASFPADTSPLLDKVQNKRLVDPAIRKLRDQRRQEHQQRNSYYIPPQGKATREATDSDLFDLTTKVNAFLGGEQKVLLLLGDSGAGKSTFNLELEMNLWKDYDKDKRNRIPIFVTLPAIEKPEQDLIAKQLFSYDFDAAQIRELKCYHEFILICDGYDECQKKVNLYTLNRLNQPGQWKVKMVISCRSEYLGSEYRLHFQPGDRNDRSGAVLLQEAVIAPFSKDNIRDYIQQYVERSDTQSIWRIEHYQRSLESIPNLQELVSNPFLLRLALEVLPNLVDSTQDLSTIKISRVTLYDQFLKLWVDRGQVRLSERVLSTKEQEDFDLLIEDGFSKNAIHYVKDLAVAIFEKQEGRPIVDYSPIQDEGTWKTAFFGNGKGKSLLREVCPLSRIGMQYRFIHRSLLEYGLARAAFDPISGRNNNEPSNLEHESTSPLYRKLFVHEPSILQFLAERVQQEDSFKQELLGFIERSKSNKECSIAAANAITILVRAGTPFNGADLNHIKVRGADLSFGQFDSAQLQRADLRETKLFNIWLRQANLRNAQMDNVEFGEWPFLQGKGFGYRNTCMYSPDGSTFAVGYEDGSISVYDAKTWENPQILQGHTSGVRSMAYSPSGQQIASGSDDNTVRLWDAHTGAPGPILSGHPGMITSLMYSPNGNQIASASDDMTIRLWNVQTGAPGLILRGHSEGVSCLVYSPNGWQIASGSYDNTARLWDAQTGTPGPIFSGHSKGVSRLVYSSNGQQIATGSFDETVRLWNVQTGEPGPILSGHVGQVKDLVYSPNGQQIASASSDSAVRLWDAQTGAPGLVLRGHTREIESLVYSPNGQQIASGSSDNTVRLWDAQTGVLRRILGGHYLLVNHVVYSPNGQQIASRGSDMTVRLWDAQNSVTAPIFSGHSRAVNSVVYSPNGQQIASISSDSVVQLWDEQTGAPGLVQQVALLSISDTVRLRGGIFREKEKEEDEEEQDEEEGGDRDQLSDSDSDSMSSGLYPLPSLDVNRLVYSSNRQRIVSGSSDNSARLQDAQTGVLGQILGGREESVMDVEYSSSSQQVALLSISDTVRLRGGIFREKEEEDEEEGGDRDQLSDSDSDNRYKSL
ncbi:hypothetical protein BGZ83_000895 [Gryganskiella cystojenkinii]|nr:hypothetical protein BGZ83_000895 [Gryganskiella cystojenkinii]